MRLRQALENCSTALLARIARQHGLSEDDGAVRSELIEAITNRLTSPGYLDAYLAELPEEERRVLEYVAGAGFEVRGFELERRVRQWTPRARPGAAPASEPSLALLQRGLLFRAFVPTGPMRGEVYTLPDEARPFIHPALAATHFAPLAEVAEPSEPAQRFDPAFDLFLAASALRRHGGRRLSQAARELAELAGPADPEAIRRWRFVLAIARHAGLLEDADVRAVPVDTIDGLFEDRDALSHRLWHSYLSCDDWNEVVESGVSPTPLLGRLRDLREVRLSVLDRLSTLEPQRWYVLESLVRAFRQASPDVLRERYESSIAGVLDQRSGQVWQGPQSWDYVEAPVLRGLLLGPLRWLGFCELASDAAGQLLVAITEQGLRLLNGVPSPLQVPPQPATLERDGTLRFPAAGHLAAMYRLEPYVRLTRAGDELEYRLDQASLADGLANGGSLEGVQRHLAAVLGAPLNERVRQTLAAWSSRYGRVALRPAIVLTVEQDEPADQLLDAPALAPLLRERLGPRAASVRAAQVSQVVDQLRAMGCFPAVDASLRLMGRRGAYAGLVDERSLELLFVATEALRRLSPTALAAIANVDELRARLQAALGTERARRLRRLARSVAQHALEGGRSAPPPRRPRRRQPAGGSPPPPAEA